MFLILLCEVFIRIIKLLLYESTKSGGLFISYHNDTTFDAKDGIADDLDGTRYGELQIMTTDAKGTEVNLLNTIGHFIVGFIEGEAAALQDLAVWGIVHTVLIHLVGYVI